MRTISVVMITKNAADTLDKSLNSIKMLANEIIIVDDFSTDQTIKIAQEYTDRIKRYHQTSLSHQKSIALAIAKEDWILFLDSDEVVSKALGEEIKIILSQRTINYDGFMIPYQNHFLGRKISRGGEDYKMLRLFKKTSVTQKSFMIHEKFELKNKPGELNNKIFHYSYRSLLQIYKKFTKYAYLTALQNKINGEKTSLKKIFLYPPHMFWARFIKDKGYKDGVFRIPLDLGFAYMEFLTYVLMLFPLKNKEI